MQETVLTTLIYKYNPYARFWIVLYIFSIFLFCVFLCDKIPMYIIWLVLCIWAIPLVYGGISRQTAFNFRVIDKRLLTLTSTYIRVGKEKYPVKDITIEVHINAYDDFIYRIRREGLLKPQAAYGNNNELLFTCEGVPYDYEFHLRGYNDYVTLCRLTDQWKAAGVKVMTKESFTREFVDKQYAKLKRPKKR